MLGNCRLLTFFKIDFFQKILSGTLSECQTVWTHIRIDFLSVLIWVQTVCKGYQQMTKLPLAGKELRYISHILSETSKPPLDIFSYIFTYMVHTWLKFTLNMEKSIKQSLSKFHCHKLKLTCSVDRLYKGTIAIHFHTNARILTHRLNRVFQGPKVKNTNFSVL